MSLFSSYACEKTGVQGLGSEGNLRNTVARINGF
jgi:hypothetical protein